LLEAFGFSVVGKQVIVKGVNMYEIDAHVEGREMEVPTIHLQFMGGNTAAIINDQMLPGYETHDMCRARYVCLVGLDFLVKNMYWHI
jgi:hypothetical protein